MTTWNFNLEQARELARVGVRRASAFMALGLRVAADNTIRSVQLEINSQIQFMPEPLSEAQSADVRANFAKWMISNGLRELDQHFAAYVDEIYPALVTMKAGGKTPPDLAKQTEVMTGDTNLGNKLGRLAEQFGISVSWRSQIASMSRARNAITHNLGRVAQRHCNDGNTLKLSWRGMDLVVGDKVISGPFEPFRVEGGTKVGFKFEERVRVFQLGQIVELSPHDLNEICLMFQFQADEIYKSTIEYARARGRLVDTSQRKADTSVESDL